MSPPSTVIDPSGLTVTLRTCRPALSAALTARPDLGLCESDGARHCIALSFGAPSGVDEAKDKLRPADDLPEPNFLGCDLVPGIGIHRHAGEDVERQQHIGEAVGYELTAEETLAVFKTADAAGLLYYKMLTMVREQRSLSELPATLKEIIKTKAWQRWRWVGSTFAQNSLGAYLTSPPPNGVGIQLETVKKLIADDPDAFALLHDEVTDEPGHPVPNQ